MLKSGGAPFLGIFINKNIKISIKSEKTQDNLNDKLKKFQKLKDFFQKLKDFRQKLKDFHQKLNEPELFSTVMFQSDVKKKPGLESV